MKSLTNAAIISAIYVILAMIKNKYVTKDVSQQKPPKQIMQESVLVFISVVLGFFAIEKLDEPISKPSAPNAFLGKPEF